jgi:hypothetical protein
MAESLRAVFDECPYEGGYDVKIGTSERGLSVDRANFGVPKGFQHALVVFGGVAGIEECVDADESMKLPGSSASTLFDLWQVLLTDGLFVLNKCNVLTFGSVGTLVG